MRFIRRGLRSAHEEACVCDEARGEVRHLRSRNQKTQQHPYGRAPCREIDRPGE